MSDNRIHKLVLDQSTSGTKLLLVGIEENEAKILRRMDRKHTKIFPQDGWVEHDPSEIVKNTKQLIAEMLEEILDYPSTASLPCVAVTEYHTSKLREDALRAGFTAYFAKPIDATSFARRLEELAEVYSVSIVRGKRL